MGLCSVCSITGILCVSCSHVQRATARHTRGGSLAFPAIAVTRATPVLVLVYVSLSQVIPPLVACSHSPLAARFHSPQRLRPSVHFALGWSRSHVLTLLQSAFRGLRPCPVRFSFPVSGGVFVGGSSFTYYVQSDGAPARHSLHFACVTLQIVALRHSHHISHHSIARGVALPARCTLSWRWEPPS